MVILISFAAVLISANYLKPKKQLAEKRTEPKQTNQVKKPKPEKPSKVLTYKQEVITVADAGEGEKDVGILIGRGEGELSAGPSNIAVDKDENIYISDYANKRIKKYDKNGTFIKNIIPPIYPWQSLVDNEKNLYVFEQRSNGNNEILKINQKGEILLKYPINDQLTPPGILSILGMRIVNNVLYLLVSLQENGTQSLPEGYYWTKIGTTRKPFKTNEQMIDLFKEYPGEDGNFYYYDVPGLMLIKNKDKKIIKKFNDSFMRNPGWNFKFLKMDNDKIYVAGIPGQSIGYTIQVYSKEGSLLSQSKPFGDNGLYKPGFDWDVQNISAVADNGTIYVFEATYNTKKDAFKILKLTLK